MDPEWAAQRAMMLILLVLVGLWAWWVLAS
jgi:hypothetical protein